MFTAEISGYKRTALCPINSPSKWHHRSKTNHYRARRARSWIIRGSLRAHSHQASCFAQRQTTNVPPPQTTAGRRSHYPGPNRAGAQLPPLHTSLNRNTAHTLLYVIVKRCLRCSTMESNTEHDHHFTNFVAVESFCS